MIYKTSYDRWKKLFSIKKKGCVLPESCVIRCKLAADLLFAAVSIKKQFSNKNMDRLTTSSSSYRELSWWWWRYLTFTRPIWNKREHRARAANLFLFLYRRRVAGEGNLLSLWPRHATIRHTTAGRQADEAEYFAFVLSCCSTLLSYSSLPAWFSINHKLILSTCHWHWDESGRYHHHQNRDTNVTTTKGPIQLPGQSIPFTLLSSTHDQSQIKRESEKVKLLPPPTRYSKSFYLSSINLQRLQSSAARHHSSKLQVTILHPLYSFNQTKWTQPLCSALSTCGPHQHNSTTSSPPPPFEMEQFAIVHHRLLTLSSTTTPFVVDAKSPNAILNEKTPQESYYNKQNHNSILEVSSQVARVGWTRRPNPLFFITGRSEKVIFFLSWKIKVIKQSFWRLFESSKRNEKGGAKGEKWRQSWKLYSNMPKALEPSEST